MSTKHYKDLAYGIEAVYDEEAGDKIKALCDTFKVDKLVDIPDKYYQMITDKIKSKVDDVRLLKMMKDVFKEEIVPNCSVCETPMYKRGLFYFCSSCKRVEGA